MKNFTKCFLQTCHIKSLALHYVVTQILRDMEERGSFPDFFLRKEEGPFLRLSIILYTCASGVLGGVLSVCTRQAKTQPKAKPHYIQ